MAVIIKRRAASAEQIATLVGASLAVEKPRAPIDSSTGEPCQFDPKTGVWFKSSLSRAAPDGFVPEARPLLDLPAFLRRNNLDKPV